MSSPTPSKEVADILAVLRKEFGKKGKREPTVQELNKKFHAKNQPLGTPAPAARLNPEDSSFWRPVAKLTHVHVQECTTCSNTTDYTGTEYIEFHSVLGMNGGRVFRKASQCPSLFLFDDLEKPLEDRIEWHYEKVSRCPGCIIVEQHAAAMVWDAHLQEQARKLLTSHKVIDITNPLPRSLDEALKPSERETT